MFCTPAIGSATKFWTPPTGLLANWETPFIICPHIFCIFETTPHQTFWTPFITWPPAFWTPCTTWPHICWAEATTCCPDCITWFPMFCTPAIGLATKFWTPPTGLLAKFWTFPARFCALVWMESLSCPHISTPLLIRFVAWFATIVGAEVIAPATAFVFSVIFPAIFEVVLVILLATEVVLLSRFWVLATNFWKNQGSCWGTCCPSIGIWAIQSWIIPCWTGVDSPFFNPVNPVIGSGCPVALAINPTSLPSVLSKKEGFFCSGGFTSESETVVIFWATAASGIFCFYKELKVFTSKYSSFL